MKYLLDTNACIEYLNYTNSSVRKKLQVMRSDDVAVCSIVEAELYYGVQKSAKSEQNWQKVEFFLSEFVSLPFDSAAAKEYGIIRADLSRKGTIIGLYDMQIGAIAKSNRLIVVTHNTKEFSRIEKLSIEDWQTET